MNHVAVLAELMRRNLWERKDKLDFARIGGRLVLVNGYHRMNAQVEAAKNVEWTIVIHECKAEADVRRLYHKFDTNVRKRTDENIIQGSDFAAAHGLSKAMARALYGAVPIISTGLSNGRVDAAKTGLFDRRITDNRLALAAEYAPAAALYERMIDPSVGVVRRKLHLSTVAAVALVTISASAEVGADFWGGLALNDGLRRGDPRATLLQTMIDRDFGRGLAQSPILACTLAWNAYWERRDLKIIKLMTGRTLRLLGTSYTVRT